MSCGSCFLSCCCMLLFWDDCLVHTPKICIAMSTTIAFGKSVPEFKAGILAAITYGSCNTTLSKTKHVGVPCTPAMAAGLTDHVWSICELLSYRIVPPPWIEPKRRGRPGRQTEQIKTVGNRLRVRPRKGVLCSTTV